MGKRLPNSGSSSIQGRHVALLRAINVGGKNKLAMKDLASVFTDAGCTGVETYIQSGNVVFECPARVLAKLADVVRAEILRRFGIEVPVVLRTGKDLERVLRANVFPGADPESLYVAFLRDEPSASRVASLNPERSPGDSFVVRGREIYIRFGASAAQTKLSVAWFDKELATVTTMRNLRTIEKLRDMALV